LIAAGNSDDHSLIPVCRSLADDSSPLVRGAAAWALLHLMPPAEFAALARLRRVEERDPAVAEEWTSAPGGNKPLINLADHGINA
jgi:epoxyqueuosine reductase